MARAVREAARYCLSFTAAGLKPELAAVMARIMPKRQLKETRAWCWAAKKPARASAKRLETELRQRLQLLNAEQLALLAEGSAMTDWPWRGWLC